MTLAIEKGETPDRHLVGEEYALVTCGYFFRLNDVLSEGFNTILARLMDSGLNGKLYRKYYMSKGM